MPTRFSAPALAAALGLALAGGLAGAAAAAVPAPDEAASVVERVREATRAYTSVEAALAAGYVSTEMCIDAAAEGMPAELGGMGIHYVRPDLLGLTAMQPKVDGTGTHTDFAEPSILIYHPHENGTLELVAAENLVFVAAWEAAGNTAAPVTAGRRWDRMVDDPATPHDEAHGFAGHYDQHVWLIDNPSGQLEPFNPTLSCPGATHAHN